MPNISRTALVPHSAEQMFRLVNDVERYPEFLPWCSAVDVEYADAEIIVARLQISRAGFRQGFTTRNRLFSPDRVTLDLIEGPFRRFHGEWRFRALAEDACKVELELDFEYSGRLVQIALGPVFNKAADMFVDAFCARARELYGQGD